MREIKFRVWRVDKNIMYPPSTIWKMNLFGCVFSDELILMQYTGLKDKNGKEIYEGDVVKVLRNDSFRPFVSEVFFSGGCFGVAFYHPLDKQHQFEYLNYWDCEIIGNIYENGDLLEDA
jgi:uncharacterized phage protein (TIGR01671 family)